MQLDIPKKFVSQWLAEDKTFVCLFIIMIWDFLCFVRKTLQLVRVMYHFMEKYRIGY